MESHPDDQIFDSSTSGGLAFEDIDGNGISRQSGVSGFDFESIFQNLDGTDPDHAAEVREQLANVFGKLINSMLYDKNGAIRDAKTIGRQLLAIGYSAGFTAELTLEQIGASQSITKQSISKRVLEAEKRLGLRRHVQPTAAARLASAIAQTGSRHWRRRKAKAP